MSYFNVEFLWIYAPKIEGIVKADAIAIISLAKKRLKDEIGKLLFYPFPNFWASFLSFINDRLVFTVKVINNFDIEGYKKGRWIWSAKFEVT